MKKIEQLNIEIKAVKLWLKTAGNELQREYMIKKLSKLYNQQDKIMLKMEYKKLIKQAEAIKIKLSFI